MERFKGAIITSCAVLAVASLFFITTVFAMESPRNNPTNIPLTSDIKTSPIIDRRQGITTPIILSTTPSQIVPITPMTHEQRCTKITAKFLEIVAKYQGNKIKTFNNFNSITTKLNAVIIKLKANNIDTIELDNELPILKQKMSDHLSDVDAIINALTVARNSVCSNTKGEGKSELSDSRAKIAKAKASLDSVKDYLLNVIKPSLQNIISNIEKVSPTTTSIIKPTN